MSTDTLVNLGEYDRYPVKPPLPGTAFLPPLDYSKYTNRETIPRPRRPRHVREIPVTELRTGMTLAGKNGTKVTSIEPCTQRGKVHVNGGKCYDLCGYIEVADR